MISITHAKELEGEDGPDTTVVRPSDWNAAHIVEGGGLFLPGMVVDFAGHTVPDGFLEAYGQSVAAATYPDLFTALVKTSTVTFTTGSPGTVNWTGHGLPINSKVRFSSTGTLPTGITAGVDYYVHGDGYSTNSFRIANLPTEGTKNLSGTPSGTATAVHAQFGAANDLSTFTVPDLRGRVIAGYERMGNGASPNILTDQSQGVNGDVIGDVGGLETSTLSDDQIPAHTHSVDPPSTALSITVSASTHTHTLPNHTHSFSGTTSSTAVGRVTEVYFSHNFQGGGGKSGLDGGATSVSSHNHTFSGTTGNPSGASITGGSHTHSASGTVNIAPFLSAVQAGLTGQAHNNVQPTVIMRKIIFAG